MTVTTVFQLLDCFILPVLLILSRVFLKTRYRVIHYVAVCVCLAGVGAMVGADLVSGRNQGSSESIVFDFLMIREHAVLILQGFKLYMLSKE